MSPTHHTFRWRIQEPAQVERITRRLIYMFKTIRPKMDASKVARHDDEHVVDFQDVEQVRKAATRRRLPIVVII